MSLTIAIEKNPNGVYTVIPTGSIDSETYSDFDKKVSTILTEDAKILVLDMSEVNYISSMGVSVILGIKKILEHSQGAMVMIKLQPPVEKVFEIVNALPNLNIFQSVEEFDKYLDMMQKREIGKE